jgi:hypothetical protein
MINNDKLNHGKPQLQLWIDSLNEMFLSRWTAHGLQIYLLIILLVSIHMQFDVNIRLYEYWHEQVKIREKWWNNKEIKKFYWK